MTVDLFIKGKRRLLFNFIAVIAVLFVMTVIKSGSAHAANFTWTGGGSGANFSTAGNWQGGTAPTGASTDALIFDNDLANFSTKTPNNDLVGADFASITFSDSSGDDTASITGNAFSVSGGMTINSTGVVANNITATGNLTITTGAAGLLMQNGNMTLGSYNLILTGSGDEYFSGVISGSGTILVSGTVEAQFEGINTYSGVTTVSSGAALGVGVANGLGSTAGKTVVQSGGTLCAYKSDSLTVAEPIDVAGTGVTAWRGALCVGKVLSFGGGAGATPTITLSGSVNLTANSLVSSLGGAAFVLSNATSNGFTITRPSGDGGSVVVNGSSLTSSVSETTISDSQPSTFLDVTENQVVTLNGTRGYTTVYGTLKGTGTTGDLLVASTGIVAPGASPGCLTSSNVTISGNYQMEIAGTTACTDYDQQVVNGTLTINSGSILSVSALNGYVPTGGDVFTMFNNDSNDAVTGTFDGLAEGATISVNGATLQLSYLGGDGNDITLTALPDSPSSGQYSKKANLYAILGLTLGLGVTVFVAKRRQRLNR